MREKPDTSSLPPVLQRAVFTLRTVGNISFWLQTVLGVISGLILLFATFSGSVGRQANQANNQGTGFGIFFAICGLVTLGVGAYFAFRYTRISRDLLASNAAGRPSKADTLQVIRLGLIVNMVGMLLTLLGAQAIVGSILAKSLSQPQGALTAFDPTRFVQPLDLFVVQANTNTIAAHFVGIAASLWLFNRVNR
jgi:hypothetical protein